MTRPTLTVVDAFTDRPFAGNPAGVALLDEFPPEQRMQALAMEMNLAETAFVVPRADGDHDLRWFTPTAEVDLCGHATLASAHVLGGSARFHTRSGLLTCAAARGVSEGGRPLEGGGSIEMDFPADAPSPVPVPPSLAATGASACARGVFDLFLELHSPDAVRSFRPDLGAIAAVDARGVVVTAAGGVGATAAAGDNGRDDARGPVGVAVDFVSRCFYPAVGVPEDPVTGSAHCALAVYWAERLGRTSLVGYQASRRGGTVRMRLEGGRVVLGGSAVTVSEVRFLV